MTAPVFVHDDTASLKSGDHVELTGPEGHHAAVVRRLEPGEALVLTDGAGASATGVVVEASKKGLTIEVGAVTVVEAEQPHVTVVQAIPKGDRGELAVEMLTEVGADVIVPWTAERCVGVWRGDRAEKSLAKWRATAREAAKQARRTHFPVVTEPANTEKVADLLRAASVRVVLHEESSGRIGDLPVPGRARIVVVVGPEGGIAPAELEAFAAVGAEPIRLGTSVLRTSTAGVAAVAALLSRSPRWA